MSPESETEEESEANICNATDSAEVDTKVNSNSGKESTENLLTLRADLIEELKNYIKKGKTPPLIERKKKILSSMQQPYEVVWQHDISKMKMDRGDMHRRVDNFTYELAEGPDASLYSSYWNGTRNEMVMDEE